ncbi:MAG: FAD-dependent oxidoreductase [Pseudomonadota bacterium]
MGDAIVIGGGIGGLLAAHALAERFDRVTVLDRTQAPAQTAAGPPAVRRGVPQSHCLHLLAGAGALAIDALVPEWREAACAQGAVPMDACADVAMRLTEGWLPRAPSRITTLGASRALLEYVLRQALACRPPVELRQGQTVAGLARGRRGDVVGVCVAGEGGAHTLGAALVVDASGAASRLTRWLGESGRSADVPETVVPSPWQYVSRWFHMPPRHAPDWHCLTIAPAADGRMRAAMMLRAEHDRWGVVLLCPAGTPMPMDEAMFAAFVAPLGDGVLADALRHARPLSPVHRYGHTHNRVRHLDRLEHWPRGLVALGDGVCVLDPYFGLGMTLAARAATLLGEHLDAGERFDACAYQRALALQNAPAWRLATAREPDGRPLPTDDAERAAVYARATSRADVAHAIIAVQHLLRPVDSLTEVLAA